MWKPHSKSTFQETCFCNPKYLLWVSKDASNTSKAYCKLCYKTIGLKSSDSNALDLHQKRQKHQELEKARKTNAMRLFLFLQSSKSCNVNQKEGPLSHLSSLKSKSRFNGSTSNASFFLFLDEHTSLYKNEVFH